jgi:hypothetical protein
MTGPQSRPKPVTNFLTSNDKDLQYVLTKALRLEKINQKISHLLGPALASVCRVANIKENQLIMIAANGTIATQVRYQTTELIMKFKRDEELKHIESILCKVSPKIIQQKEIKEKERDANFDKMPFLSKETSKIIKEIADSIQDPKLKEAMKKIASHIDKSTK